LQSQKNYLLDTNSIIYFLQGYKELDMVFDKFVRGTAFPSISIITEIELLSFPKITSKEEKLILELLSNFRIYEVDRNIAEQTIKLRKQYLLKIPDAIIAATALQKGAVLVTRDEEHFKRIKGLVVLNPFKK